MYLVAGSSPFSPSYPVWRPERRTPSKDDEAGGGEDEAGNQCLGDALVRMPLAWRGIKSPNHVVPRVPRVWETSE